MSEVFQHAFLIPRTLEEDEVFVEAASSVNQTIPQLYEMML